MILIHIHVLTCVNTPISIGHMTTQTNITSILGTLVNFETIALLPIFNCNLIVLHDSVNFTY